jgi:hypothetical protein
MRTVLGALKQLLVPELCNTDALLALGAAKVSHGARNSESITLFLPQPFGLFVQVGCQGRPQTGILAVNTVLFRPDTEHNALSRGNSVPNENV